MKTNDVYKEIGMLCLVSSTVCFINFSPLFYPYIASDYFHKNNNLKMEDFYSCFFFLFLGFPIGNFITRFAVNVFGLSDAFLIVGLTYIMSAIIFYTYNSLYEIFCAFLLVGIQFQICITTINLVLTQKYENGLKYYKYMTTSRLFYAFSIVIIAMHFINNENKPPTVVNKYNNVYFEKEISDKSMIFLIYFNLVNAVICFLTKCYVTNPSHISNKFGQFLQYLMGSDTFPQQFNREDVEASMSSYNTGYSNASMSQSQLHSQLMLSFTSKKSQQQKLLDKNTLSKKRTKVKYFDKIQKYKKFIIVYLLFFVINTMIDYYCLDQYKYVGLIIGISDKTLSYSYSLSSFFYISSNYVLSYFWENCSFNVVMYFFSFTQFLQIFCILISKTYKNMFILSVFAGRFNMGYNDMLSDISCFGFFAAQDAIRMTTYFSFTKPVSVFIEVGMNYFIFTEKNYTRIYYCFAFLFAIQLYIILVVFKTLKLPKKINQNQYRYILITFLIFQLFNFAQYKNI